MRSRRLRRGFTLIELVVVISLMAVIVGVSAPALASLDHRATDSSAVDVAIALLRRSRTSAIDRAIAVHLTIDPSNARYWVYPPETSGVLAMRLGAKLVARVPRVHYWFSPDGETQVDEPLFVRQNGTSLPVIIEPWTGEVRSASR
jgi:prepilin-type N-terminal cleavage/methylation domain-containing protein